MTIMDTDSASSSIAKQSHKRKIDGWYVAVSPFATAVNELSNDANSFQLQQFSYVVYNINVLSFYRLFPLFHFSRSIKPSRAATAANWAFVLAILFAISSAANVF